jgi:hypothetical protein
MARTLGLLLLVLLEFPAFGQAGWKDSRGQLSPDTESRKSVDGFGGWLVATSDADWQAKWQTPSDAIPFLHEAKTVARGKQVFVLTLFANPLLDAGGTADITCDIDVLRPDGTTSIHQIDAPCFKGPIHGSPSQLFLSAPVIGFTGDPGDPAGKWTVRVTLKDNVRRATIPLRTSFVLEK